MGKRYYYRFISMVIMTIICVFSFLFVWRLYVNRLDERSFLQGRGNIVLVGTIYVMLFITLGHFLHAFRVGVEHASKLIASVILTVAITDMTEIIISAAIIGNIECVKAFAWRYILLTVIQCAILGPLSIFMVNLYVKIVPPLRVLVITGNYENDIHEKLSRIDYKYKVDKTIRYDDPLIVEDIINSEAVLINDLPSHDEHAILKQCFDLDKRVYVLPKISDIIIKSSDDLNILDTPLYLCRNMGISKVEGAIKRFFDVLLSGLALVVLSPVFLVVSIAIKLDDRGPVFFKQERVTLHNRRFIILKFRSMIVDAEKDGRPHPAGERDPRITKVGRIIRETRIDELPQLINILKGDMSIVGPRPERYEHVDMYTKEIPEFSFRSKVRGGLTGYAQVYGKYNTSALDKLKLDLMYITNFSILLDLQIILETLKIIFIKESTEGFTETKIKEIHDTAVQHK